MSSQTFNIAVLPGDGIGVDVTAEAVRVLQAVASRLNSVRFEFREFSVGAGELATRSPDGDVATDTMRITRRGAERVMRAAFRQAVRRRGLVTLVDKSNVLPSMVFFRSIFDAVAREFPEVRTERIYVDAAALYLVQRPHTFDVLVTENMFGDILSDLAAGLVGGMGMAPSADLEDLRPAISEAVKWYCLKAIEELAGRET